MRKKHVETDRGKTLERYELLYNKGNRSVKLVKGLVEIGYDVV